MSILLVDDGTPIAERILTLVKSVGLGRRKRLKLGQLREEKLKLGEGQAFRLVLYPGGKVSQAELDRIVEHRRLAPIQDLPWLIYTQRKPMEPQLLKLADIEAVSLVSSSASDAEIQLQLQSFYHFQRKVEFLTQSEQHWHETALLLREMNNQLEELSNIDPLTNLSNRRHFDDVLQVEWKRALRHKTPVSILMIDIDHFKRFNDKFGHLAGDDCLQQVGQALREHLRRPADLLARYGGEEFIVLLPQTQEEGAAVVAEFLRQKIEELEVESGGEPLKARLTVSVGVASLVPEPELQPALLVERADQALYQAKRAGRNQVAFASEGAQRASS